MVVVFKNAIDHQRERKEGIKRGSIVKLLKPREGVGGFIAIHLHALKWEGRVAATDCRKAVNAGAIFMSDLEQLLIEQVRELLVVLEYLMIHEDTLCKRQTLCSTESGGHLCHNTQ